MRLFDYPSGYQVRIYDKVLDIHLEEDVTTIDYFTGEIKLSKSKRKKKSDKAEFPVNEWMLVDKTFEEYSQEFDLEMDRKKSESIRCSMTRTISNLYYISRSNIWDYFLTFTLDPKKIDRFNYLECSKRVRKSFNNLKMSKCPNMYYLVVPEQHKNGAWHFHGLLGNTEGLNFVYSGMNDKKDRPIYNLTDYKLGFTTVTKVTDSAKASSYICKYITKSLCGQTKGLQRYYVSKNCHRAVIYESFISDKDLEELKFTLITSGCFSKTVKADYVTTYFFELPDKQLLNNFLDVEILD